MTHTDRAVGLISEIIYDYLDERFPEGALPGGIQLFATDHLDAEFKHEAGCEELAKRIIAALPSADALREAREALDWFGEHKSLGLSFHYPVFCEDPDQAEEWRVEREQGGINDREYVIVGRGQTPLAAIEDARAALATLDGGKEKGSE